MTLSPTITLAVVPSDMILYPRKQLLGSPLVRTVLFYLQIVRDERRCFYECSYEGCPGCGCPSFELDDSLIIPDWVLDTLRLHVQLYHSAIAGED